MIEGKRGRVGEKESSGGKYNSQLEHDTPLSLTFAYFHQVDNVWMVEFFECVDFCTQPDRDRDKYNVG